MRNIKSICQFANVHCMDQRNMDALCASSNSSSFRHMQVYEERSISLGKPTVFVGNSRRVRGQLNQAAIGTLSFSQPKRWALPIAGYLTVPRLDWPNHGTDGN